MTGPLFDITVAVRADRCLLAFCFGLVVGDDLGGRKGAAYIQDRRGPNRPTFSAYARGGSSTRWPTR